VEGHRVAMGKAVVGVKSNKLTTFDDFLRIVATGIDQPWAISDNDSPDGDPLMFFTECVAVSVVDQTCSLSLQ
jgi:hypothetical protein